MQFIALPGDPTNAFHLRQNADHQRVLDLLAQPPGSRAAPSVVWSRRFETAADRDTLLGAVNEGQLDTVFLGRLTMMFGSAALDELADRMVAAARLKLAEEQEKAAQRARDHLVVNLYSREGKYGRHVLELQRLSSNTAEWSVTYGRAIERDRLCDWLRWQRDRFVGFLDHAAEHGGEALSQMLVDEMFMVERRVKKEGRGAGGMRPLRMWRGN
ncbi:hypothetical protein [Sphingomonas sp. UYP23]